MATTKTTMKMKQLRTAPKTVAQEAALYQPKYQENQRDVTGSGMSQIMRRNDVTWKKRVVIWPECGGTEDDRGQTGQVKRLTENDV